jgi:hypothetical protein
MGEELLRFLGTAFLLLHPEVPADDRMKASEPAATGRRPKSEQMVKSPAKRK